MIDAGFEGSAGGTELLLPIVGRRRNHDQHIRCFGDTLCYRKPCIGAGLDGSVHAAERTGECISMSGITVENENSIHREALAEQRFSAIHREVISWIG